METMLEGYATEEQSSVVCFLWAKGLVAKDIRKEIFLVYGGKCLWRKAVHNWVDKFCKGRSKVADNVRPGAEVAETAVYAAGFITLVKRWDKCINVGGGYVEKEMFSQVRISHVLRFIYIWDLFTDCPLYVPETVSVSILK
jgi:hypothetical protein